ncbi:MAG TPA: HPr kinase/phosphatase C-terminal domain-containing protein [Stellaceae bacterium]|jgi:serine kinase of HPr protein (carbohydrate metabolism regulator)|nr:HPr kinase/phosphatase C-terminal domain-containing protein [Stellaceae bacterium]
MSERLLVHGTAIAIDGGAVLLRGASGAGKSDLGLRLIDAGGRLIADDQSELHRIGDTIAVRAPAAISGLIEVRGLGILRLDTATDVPLLLIADLVAPQALERLPERRSETILGLSLPVLSVAPFEASAVAKLRLALQAIGGAGGVSFADR